MEKRNKGIYALLYNLMNADGVFQRKEYGYMLHVANALGLSEETIEEIAHNPEGYNLEPPAPEQERMTVIYYMLFAMQIDGEIHPKEEIQVMKAGIKLGFHEPMLREMIDTMKFYLKEVMPDDALMKIIKKYMN